MPDDELQPRADRFDRYLDALLGGERPSPDDIADRDEAEMARLAAELSAAVDPDEGRPDPDHGGRPQRTLGAHRGPLG